MSETSASPIQNITLPIDVVPTSAVLDGTPKKRNYMIWLLAILVLVVVFTTSFLILTNKSKSIPTGSLIQPTPSFSETSVKESDPTANWKTYTNTKYAYSVKIPPEWGVDTDPSIILTEDEFQKQDNVRWLGGTGWGTYFTISVLKDCTSSLEQCFAEVQKEDEKINGPYSPSITTFEVSTFLDSKTIIAHSRQMFPPPKTAFRGIFLVHAGKLWLFETHTSLEIDKKPELGEQETDQILSTFKFIDSQNVTSETSVALSDPKLVEFVRSYLKMGAETQLTIERVEGNYAYGTGGTTGGGGFYWAAAKKNGQWNYAFGGNGIPDCSEVEIFPVGTFKLVGQGGKFDECYQTQKRMINRNNSVKYSPQAKLYTSKRLGLNLYYLPERHDGVNEEGNRIYVTNGASKQFVEIFSKKEDEIMIDAISRTLLTKFDKEKCVVISKIEKDPTKTYDSSTSLWTMPIGKFYEIEDKTRKYADDVYYCPGDYSQASGARYFVEDEDDKTKFYFYDIGQYTAAWEIEQINYGNPKQ